MDIRKASGIIKSSSVCIPPRMTLQCFARDVIRFISGSIDVPLQISTFNLCRYGLFMVYITEIRSSHTVVTVYPVNISEVFLILCNRVEST